MIPKMQLKILPMGKIDDKILKILKTHLKTLFSKIEIFRSIPIIESAYNPKRDQYLANDFLERMKNVPGDHVLGVTDVDLYVPELNFVLGLAQLPGKAAIISLHRLHSDRLKLYHDRMIKEAVHELGHTFGLRHCPDKFCVMHFSNCLEDTDIKGGKYCNLCEESLQNLI